MRWALSVERGKYLGRLLSASKGLLEDCMAADPQMDAVRRIVKTLGPIEGAAYVVGVALVSYMLSTRGEEHWRLAAEYAETPARDSLTRFVLESPSLGRFRRTRERRVRRYARTTMRRILSNYSVYALDPRKLWRDLAMDLGARLESKTVVFAVKMFCYALKASGLQCATPTDVPVPVDYRVCLISLTSMLVRGDARDLKSAARELRATASTIVRRGWDVVAAEAGVAPLDLDALLWLLGGSIEKGGFEMEESLRAFGSILARSLEPPEESLIRELLLGLQ